MNAEERFDKALAEYGDNVTINVAFRGVMIDAIKAAHCEAIEECVSVVEQFLGPGITILHVPRARASLIAHFRALKEE